MRFTFIHINLEYPVDCLGIKCNIENFVTQSLCEESWYFRETKEGGGGGRWGNDNWERVPSWK